MFHHVSVLLKESIEGLNIKEDGIYVDCTLGGGGHSGEILKRLTTGHLYAFDQDQTAIEAARKHLQAIGSNFTLIPQNFKNLKTALEDLGVDQVDGILFDLGVSSPQFDEAKRGFSYNQDARLDMRMDQRQILDAYTIVNTWSYADLVHILYRYSDEKYAKAIAKKIEQERAKAPIETTFQLVEVVKAALPAAVKRRSGHPAKRTFQALRIAVNDELNVFHDALLDALDLLAPNGRIAVITFHSLEDRLCKQIFKDASEVHVPKGLPIIPPEMQPKFTLVYRKAIVPGEKELAENHRSHSAKLRLIERKSCP